MPGHPSIFNKMVKCNESLLSPREKRSIVRGVKNKYKDKNFTDEDMKNIIDEAMANAVKVRSPKRLYCLSQSKPYQRRRIPGSVVRATETEDFIPLSTSGHFKAFLEEEEHGSAFEVETSSEERVSTSEGGDSEDKVTPSEGDDSEDKVSPSESDGTEGSEDEGSEEEKEPAAEASSEGTSVGCIQESDSDSYDDLDDDDSIIGQVRRFCCGRRY